MDNTSSKKHDTDDKNIVFTEPKETFNEASKDTSKEPPKEDTTRLNIRNTCLQLEQSFAEFEKEGLAPNRAMDEKIRIQKMRVQLATIREQIESLS